MPMPFNFVIKDALERDCSEGGSDAGRGHGAKERDKPDHDKGFATNEQDLLGIPFGFHPRCGKVKE